MTLKSDDGVRKPRFLLDWRTCLRAGVSVVLVYLAIHYWPALTGIIG